jgi:hypothetical protein
VGAFEQVNRNVGSKAGSGICRKKAQNTQRVDVSPFASLALSWQIVLLSVFTDDKKTYRQ